MKRFVLTSLVLSMALALVTACNPYLTTDSMDSNSPQTNRTETKTCSLTVATEPSEGGHIRHSGGGGEGEFRFESGEVVEFMAVAAEGYQFEYWGGDLSGEGDTVRLVMDSDKTVTAHFSTTALHALTVAAEPSGEGHIRHSAGGGEGEFQFKNGEVVEFMAVADEGYQFEYWGGDLSGEGDTVRLVMDSDKTVTAHFSAAETVAGTYALRVEADPLEGGYIRPGSGVYDNGEVVEFMAVADEGYQFDYWSGDLSSRDDTARLVMDDNKWVVAHFSPVGMITGTYALRVEADPPEAGYVRPGSGVYDNGEVLTIVAVAAEGYRFDYWSGDLSGWNDTTRLAMDDNKWVIAHFTR